MDLIWLIALIPAAGAAINGLFGIRWFRRTAAGALACAAMAAAFGLSVWAFAWLIEQPAQARMHEVVLGDWIPEIPLATVAQIGMFKVAWALRLDPLSAVMLLVVTGVGFLVHVYSTACMKDEPPGGYARFFCYMNLFCAFMALLVLAGNFLVMFVGWEGVGLCSYLLIGFRDEKTGAADAAQKAFLVNRIGGCGLLLGVFLVFFTFGTLDFREVASAAAARPAEAAGFGALSAICILLFVGAAAKSAQIPFFVWLPDAMAGPTPVSALIHAATMVTAGVYVVARNAVLFERAPLVMQIVAIAGALTALMAATIALVQTEIKRVLAYSTISQLGYMFLATGVGAFAAAVFHLVTHGLFKALLILGSGSVVDGLGGEQDMRRMGGLKQYMPVTFVTMMVGTLAIAGIPPFAGFFSKDQILHRAFAGNRTLWGIAAATAVLTGLYMYRLMALTFYGSYRGSAWPRASPAGPRDPPAAMTAPMMALAVGTIVAGVVGLPPALGGADAIGRFLAPSFTAGVQPQADATQVRLPGPAGITASPAIDASPTKVRPQPDARAADMSSRAQLGLMASTVLIAGAGVLLGRHYYVVRPEAPARLAEQWPGIHALVFNRYYVDELYQATIVRGCLAGARELWRVDRGIVDGAVEGSGAFTRVASWIAHMLDKHVVEGIVTLLGWGAGRISFIVRRAQTGLVQNYALLMVLGLLLFLTMFLLAG